MNRRKFLQTTALGGTAFVVNLGLHNPQSANAFLFALLGGTLMDMAFGALMQGAFSVARGVWSRRTQEWYDNRLEAQLAQSKFLDNRFARSASDIIVADVRSPMYTYILAAQRREQLGYNVAFGFPQMRYSTPSIASFAGPAAIGMAKAAEYLRYTEKLSLEDVQSAILPRYQDYNDWQSWSQPVSYTTYRTAASQNGVVIEYRAIDQRPGGYGVITVVVDTYRQFEISIKIQYA
jgi:hypothetical protein